jgi:putative PEP-CTERM system TPR-repeat lipoprotein
MRGAATLTTTMGQSSFLRAPGTKHRRRRFGRTTILLVALSVCFSSSCVRSPEEKSAAWIKSAKGYLEKKDYAAAIIELRNAIAATPKNPEAQYRMGMALLLSGESARSVPYFKSAADLDPNQIDARLKLSGILSEERDEKLLSIAEQYAQAAVKLRPDDPEALSALAVAEWRQNKIELARQHLKQALLKNPAHPKAASTLAHIQWSVDHDVQGAERTFRDAVEHSSNSPDALVALGRFYAVVGKPVEAEAQFQRAIKTEPNHAGALLELSKLQRSSGRQAEAEQTLRRLSALPDKSYRALHAQFLFQSGQRDAAIQELKKEWEADPRNIGVRSSLVHFYIETSRIADAEQVLAAALKRDPRDADALEQQVQVYLVERRFDDARKAAEAAVRQRPQSASSHYALAKAHRGQGRMSEYRSELKFALDKDPGLVQARVDLSESLRNAKLFRDALELIDGAPQPQQEQLELLVERGWILMAMGRHAAAKVTASKALTLKRTPAALLLSGLLELEEKKNEAGRGLIEEALGKAPDSLVALNALASSLASENRAAAATERLRKQASQWPKSAPIQFALGSWLERMGDIPAARQAYAAAVAADAAYPPAEIGMARMEMLQGQWSNALSRVEGLLAANPGNIDALLALGMIKEGTGEHEAAISAYRRILQIEPENITALNNLVARLCESPATTGEAVSLAQRLKEAAPDSPVVDDTVGWAYYKQGQFNLAIQYLLRASNANDAQTKYHLAMAYFRAGKRNLGEKALASALQLNPGLPEAKLAKSLAESTR